MQRNNLTDSFENSFDDDNDIVSFSTLNNNNTANAEQQQLIVNANSQAFQATYDKKLNELNAAINILDDQKNMAVPFLRELHAEITSIKDAKFSGRKKFLGISFTEFSDDQLMDVLDKSTALIQAINIDNTHSEVYPQRLDDLNAVTKTLKTDAKENRLGGIIQAATAALAVAGVIALGIVSVLTFGGSLPLIGGWLGGVAAMGALMTTNFVSAHSLFKQSNKQFSLAGKMEELDNKLKVY